MLKKSKDLIAAQLNQGASPHGLALSCTLGCLLGCFPLMGTTTLLCVAVGVALRLNHPALQLANYAMGPFQLVLIPVYVILGERALGLPPTPLRPDLLVEQFTTSPYDFFVRYGKAGLVATGTWTILAPLAGVVLYFIFRYFFEKTLTRLRRPR